MKQVVADEELIKVVKSLSVDIRNKLSKAITDNINSNMSSLLITNDFANLRYIQGYISSMVELVSILSKEGGTTDG